MPRSTCNRRFSTAPQTPKGSPSQHLHRYVYRGTARAPQPTRPWSTYSRQSTASNAPRTLIRCTATPLAGPTSSFGLSCCRGYFGVRTFEVPKGQIRLANDGSGNYLIYGPGVHRVNNLFMQLGRNIECTTEVIQHG